MIQKSCYRIIRNLRDSGGGDGDVCLGIQISNCENAILRSIKINPIFQDINFIF